MVSMIGLNKVDVLIALYNAAKTYGNDVPLTTEEAETILNKTTFVNRVNGRVIKVGFNEEEFVEWWYDSKNGEGTARKAVEALRKEKNLL